MCRSVVIHYGNGNMGSMEGQPVEEVDCETDLGVTFTTDLKTVQHTVNTPVSKADRI